MNENNAHLYNEKLEDYFDGARHDIIDYLKTYKSLTILEVGCGSGQTGSIAINKGIAKEYDAIEINHLAAEKAKKKLTNVFCADSEQFDFNKIKKQYDCIIMSEVLEHLIDPWNLLKKIAPLLKTNGTIFASSPNICSYQVILNLLAGKFEYSEHGVMDKTHLRWFTPSSYEKMFYDTGYKTISIGPVAKLGKKASILNNISARKWNYLWHNQIMYIGTISSR